MRKLLVLILIGILCFSMFSFLHFSSTASEGLSYGSAGAVSTIGTTAEFRCTRNIVEVGGYFFCFYLRTTDYHLVCRSSSDGLNWNPEQDVSDSILEGTFESGVFTDGTNVLVGFYNGTDSISNMTATSFYIRNGTQNGGTITWSSAIEICQGGGCSYHGFSFCKTAAGYYWVSFCYIYTEASPYYCISVYNSSDLSSWDLSLSTTSDVLVNGESCCETQITYDPQYSNGVMLVADAPDSSTFGYTVFDNNEWSPPSTFASKTPVAFDYSGWSLATGNDQIQFVCEPATWNPNEDAYVGGPLTSYNYTTSWSDGVRVDSSTCWGPSLTPYNSTTMYLFYYNDSLSTVYYRALTYSTMKWTEPTALATGETLVKGEDTVLSEQNPPSSNIGVVWGGENGSSLNGFC